VGVIELLCLLCCEREVPYDKEGPYYYLCFACEYAKLNDGIDRLKLRRYNLINISNIRKQ